MNSPEHLANQILDRYLVAFLRIIRSKPHTLLQLTAEVADILPINRRTFAEIGGILLVVVSFATEKHLVLMCGPMNVDNSLMIVTTKGLRYLVKYE